MRAVAGDITTEAGRAAALAACPQVDILVNNAGGPPPGDFRQWDREAWIQAIDANMLTPIELMKATVDKMAERGFGRVVNITSGAVKAPIDALGLSNGARSGLTGFVAGLARSKHRRPRRHHQRPAAGRCSIPTGCARPCGARRKTRRQERWRTSPRRAGAPIPAQRFGSAEEFGAICAFLCSVHAGYLTGQNVLVDGGAYPGRSSLVERRRLLTRHVGAAVPALVERAVDDLAAAAAGPVPVGRMAQGVEQAARALELGVVADPDLGQRLIRRQLAGDAAGVHPLHRRRRCPRC